MEKILITGSHIHNVPPLGGVTADSLSPVNAVNVIVSRLRCLNRLTLTADTAHLSLATQPPPVLSTEVQQLIQETIHSLGA